MYRIVAIRSDFIIVKQDDGNIQMIPRAECNLNLTVGEEVDIIIDGEKITLIKKNSTSQLLPVPTDVYNNTADISSQKIQTKASDTTTNASTVTSSTIEQTNNGNNNDKNTERTNKFLEYIRKFINKITFKKKKEEDINISSATETISTIKTENISSSSTEKTNNNNQ